MKRFITLGVSALFILLTSFNINKGLEDVISALSSGNANELARYVDDNIEIGLPDKSDTYGKAQAVMIFRNFFATHGVRSFEVKHKGDNGGKQFCVGTLYTRNGNFRTTVFMTTRNGVQLVKEIRFQHV